MGEKSYCNCCLTLYKISKIFVLIYGEQYSGKNAFLNKNSNKEKFYKDKISELERIIGKQAVYIEILKKTSEMM